MIPGNRTPQTHDDLRSFFVVCNRALKMVVQWLDQWLATH